MSPADVVHLLEVLCGGWSVKDLRTADAMPKIPLDNLADEDYALLVRFVAGERPSVGELFAAERAAGAVSRAYPPAAFDDDDPPPPKEDIEIGGETGVRLLG
jgi:hypothetical protein